MGLLVTGVLIDDYPMYLLILPLMRHEIALVLMVSCDDYCRLRHSHIKPSPSSGSLKFKPSQSQTLFSKALSSQAHSLPLFLSLLKMAKDTWTPEEVRYFFELYAEERRKGNRTTSMNKIGKQNIIEAFEKSSRGKIKRKEKDLVVEACDKRPEAFMVKNRIVKLNYRSV
ncbi:hypothetical protein YC2023_060390 [Brassica napus]